MILISFIFFIVNFWAFFTSPQFVCHLVFLVVSWYRCQLWTQIVHEEYNPTISVSSYLFIHVKSVLLAMCSVEWFDTWYFNYFSSNPCCLWSSCSWCTLTQAHECALVRFLRDMNSQFLLVELCSLGLGWETALPTGTHRVMSMGM